MKVVILQHDNGKVRRFGAFADTPQLHHAVNNLRLCRNIAISGALPKTSDLIIAKNYPWWEEFAGGLNGYFAVQVFDCADSATAVEEPLTCLDQGSKL